MDLVVSGAVKNRYIASEIEQTKEYCMSRDVSACLSDGIDACDAITNAVRNE